MAGREDHFLFNCALRLEWMNPLYNFGVLLFNRMTDEDDQTDKAYNVKGEEFAEWGKAPPTVPNWLKDGF